MTSSMSRHSKAYFNLMRSDIANNFRKNVFLRQPNIKVTNAFDLPYSVTK